MLVKVPKELGTIPNRAHYNFSFRFPYRFFSSSLASVTLDSGEKMKTAILFTPNTEGMITGSAFIITDEDGGKA